MKLCHDAISSLVNGVAYISEEAGLLSFHRFTKEQEEAYRQRSAE